MTKSNDVLEANFQHIKETLSRMEEYTKEKLDRIESQVVKTNGRVNKLEDWKAKIDGGSTVAKFAWGVASVFLFSSVAALFNMYIELKSIDERIANTVAREISNMEFEIIK